MPDENLIRQKYQKAQDLSLRDFLQEKYSQKSCDWHRWLFEQIPDLSRATLLDLGCGVGSFWWKNADRIPSGWQIVLVDLISGMLQEARKDLKSVHMSPGYVQASTEGLPFKPKNYSVILAAGLFDHVEDLASSILHIHRLLEPGGWLCATTGGQDHLRELAELVRPFAPQAKLGRVSNQFSLENGCSILSSTFPSVERRVFLDELVFREPDPIIAYLRSEAELREVLKGKNLVDFYQHLARRLKDQSPVRITIEKAVFLAQKSG